MGTLTATALVTAVALLSVVAWFDARCLSDLKSSPAPLVLTRQAWALLIVFVFPIGGILYLMYGRRR